MEQTTLETTWIKWKGCKCIEYISKKNGYDNASSLELLDDNKLEQVENLLETDRQHILNEIFDTAEKKCNHFKTYTNQKKIAFLLGHKTLLLRWCQDLKENRLKGEAELTKIITENAAFSPIMKGLLLAALKNYHKTPNNHRFSDVLMDFAIYIYIMMGRAAYEIVAANTALPKAQTIGEKELLNY